MARTARSPAYPGMTLEEAIAKTHQFYAQNKRYPVDRSDDSPAAYISIGFRGANGASKRALAALLSFGLLEKVGTGGDGKVQVSERGYKIIALPDDDPARAEHIRAAALEPRIYADLVATFSEGLPPSDTALMSELVNRRFNRDSIPHLVADFKATYEFAQLGKKSGTIPEGASVPPPGGTDPNAGTGGDNNPLSSLKPYTGDLMSLVMQEFQPKSAIVPKVNPNPENAPKGVRVHTIPLSGGLLAILQVPTPMTPRALQSLKKYLNLLGDSMVDDEPAESVAPSVRQDPAMWQTKEADIPVVVVGYKGFVDGRHYASIEGSDTGVPIDELVYGD